MAAVLTIALIAAVLWAWFCAFWLVPSNLRGLFRYCLWRLRDELADDIREEAFDRSDEPRRVLETVECFIANAESLTPVRIALILGLIWPHRHRIGRSEDDKPLSLRGLSPDDKLRLGNYIQRFNRMVSRQIFLGSPSGWLIGGPAWLAVKTLKLLDKIFDDDRRDFAYDVQRRTTEASMAALNASHAEPVGEHALSQYVG